MSTPVETTIRTHLQANDAVQETIDWAEIVARLETVPSLVPVPQRSNRRGVWVAVAAAVITILLIGVVPLLTGSDGTPPADTVVPTTVAAPVSTSAHWPGVVVTGGVVSW